MAITCKWKKTGFLAVYKIKYAESSKGKTVNDITLVRMDELDVGEEAEAEEEFVVVSTIR